MQTNIGKRNGNKDFKNGFAPGFYKAGHNVYVSEKYNEGSDISKNSMEMTIDEMEDIRKKLGLSVLGLTRVLNINKTTLYNMRYNKNGIKYSTALALRLMLALYQIDSNNKALPEEIRNARR